MTAYDFWNIICSLPKTLRFNLRYFPLKTAMKLPVFVSRRTYLREMNGKITLPEKVETAMVRIGFGDVGHYDRKRSRSIWQVSGTVNFHGRTCIGHGSKLSVRGELTFGSDFDITAESTIVCADKITFGNDCLLSWDILVTDTDEHPLYNSDGERLNSNKPVVVGNHVWIGCKCVLLKGAAVPDNTVVAAGTLLKSVFEGANMVIGGNPPTVLKSEVHWER